MQAGSARGGVDMEHTESLRRSTDTPAASGPATAARHGASRGSGTAPAAGSPALAQPA